MSTTKKRKNKTTRVQQTLNCISVFHFSYRDCHIELAWNICKLFYVRSSSWSYLSWSPQPQNYKASALTTQHPQMYMNHYGWKRKSQKLTLRTVWTVLNENISLELWWNNTQRRDVLEYKWLKNSYFILSVSHIFSSRHFFSLCSLLEN